MARCLAVGPNAPLALRRLGGKPTSENLAFRSLTAAFAAGRSSLLAAMALQMARASVLSLGEFGFGFVLEPRVGSGSGRLRRPAVHLRDGRVARWSRWSWPCRCRSGSRSSSPSSRRRWCGASVGFVVELLAAVPERHLRAVGGLRPRAVAPRHRRAGARARVRLPAVLPGAPPGRRHARGWR